MLEVKKAVITQADLYTRALKPLKAAFPGIRYLQISIQINPLELMCNLYLHIKLATNEGEEYESKDDWCLFNSDSTLQEYVNALGLLELFSESQEEVRLEDLQGKEVFVIVDDNEYPKRDAVLALGVNKKFVLPNWIEKRDGEGRTYYTEGEALKILAEII